MTGKNVVWFKHVLDTLLDTKKFLRLLAQPCPCMTVDELAGLAL